MNRLIPVLAVMALFSACQEHEPVKNDFSGNESTYALVAGSTYPVNGTVTFKERTDGSAVVTVVLAGTEGDIQHPVHLHLGNISSPDADVAALLNPVVGKTGISETHLTILADESTITYAQLLELNACIKVHLSAAGQDKDIVLAGGNIGTAATDSPTGRSGMSVCKSF